MKASDLPKEVLLQEFIKKVKQEALAKFPRLANEPFSEYNETIREEVEYTATTLVVDECNRKFGKENKKWKEY